MQILTEIKEMIAKRCDLTLPETEQLLETPPEQAMGDLALPCFRFAKTERKAPALIASKLAQEFSAEADGRFRVRAQGPYVNFDLNRARFARELFADAYTDTGLSGRRDIGQGKTVLVEFSSPNIAKPFHVGHAFSTLIGDALANLYSYLGYDVVRLNHLGDYGTQFGKLISAWKRWGDEKALEENAIAELTRVYVKFHAEAENDPELVNEGRDYFRRLEAGEEEEVKLWQRFRDLSLKEFDRLYQRLGIRFDNFNGESFYSDKIPAVVDRLREKKLLAESEGAQVVMLDEFNLNPCLILKSDGTTIYASRDLAAIEYRAQKWNFYRNIYVVGMEQINHFQQVFAVLRKMGHEKQDACVHVAFGRVKFKEGEFSTRKGKVVLLEDLLNETVAKTLSIIRSNNSEQMSEQDMEETAERVGLAAVKHTFLRNGREKTILFDWDDMLDFDGDTAPYLLYTVARARSVLRKAKADEEWLKQADYSLLIADEEFQLLKGIARLQEAAEAAAEEYEPCLLMRQISQIARDFNRFYHQCAILKTENEALRCARLALCDMMSKQLSFALTLLGIESVDRM